MIKRHIVSLLVAAMVGLPVPAWSARDRDLEALLSFGGTPEWVTTMTNNSIVGAFLAILKLLDGLDDFGASAQKAAEVAGALVSVPTAKVTGCAASTSVAVDPTDRFMYANVSVTHGGICGYAMDRAGGTLTPIPGMPFAAGADPETIAIDPVGTYLYVANYTDDTISAYTIDAASGALAPVPGSPFAGGPKPHPLVVEPRGRYVYSAGTPLKQTQGAITVSSIDRATGALTPVAGSPLPTVDNPLSFAADPTGRYLYAAGGALQAYAIDQATGALAPIGAALPYGKGLVIDPSGRFLYVIRVEGIQVYAIGGDGTLAAIGAPKPAGANPVDLAIAKSGRFLYASNLASGNISGYAIDFATGALTELAGSPYAAGANVMALATSGAMTTTEIAVLGAPYANRFQAVGGRPLYTWSVADGALPPGLSLGAASGMLTGTPTLAGTYAFTARVTDSLGATSSALATVIVGDASTVRPNYEGLWWNAPAASESGWGINFAHQGDILFASWYTYDVDNLSLWMVVAATRTGPNTYTGTLYRGTGPPFARLPFDPAEVAGTAVGTATFTFADTDHATFSYVIGAVAQTKNIVRQVFANPVPVCTWPAPTDLAAATNYQDLWWGSPAGSEPGWGINLTHQADTVFGTWFTFGSDSEPLWMAVSAVKIGTGVYTGNLYRAIGPAFSAVPFDPELVKPRQMGTATFTFTDGNHASFATVINGVAQARAITRQVFAPPGTLCR